LAKTALFVLLEIRLVRLGKTKCAVCASTTEFQNILIGGKN
jgi:hypothetical protein